ncbi:MAG TPA: invasion associated locus B family protein [Stellaceae bacterium]|jgi:invasion protein IalB|nr:invasion associated locus B family protein [Stellaceae bacterium]
MRVKWVPVIAAVISVGVVGAMGYSSFAQQRNAAPPPAAAAEKKAEPPAAAEPPGQSPKINLQPGGGWVSRCESQSREKPVECFIEQNVVVSSSGQLLAAVAVRVPAETRQPAMTIQVPVGLYLPGGLNIQVDEGKPESLAFQTCEVKGCYALTPVSKELLAAMKSGKIFKVTVQNLNKENIGIPLTLANFSEAYQKIQ